MKSGNMDEVRMHHLESIRGERRAARLCIKSTKIMMPPHQEVVTPVGRFLLLLLRLSLHRAGICLGSVVDVVVATLFSFFRSTSISVDFRSPSPTNPLRFSIDN